MVGPTVMSLRISCVSDMGEEGDDGIRVLALEIREAVGLLLILAWFSRRGWWFPLAHEARLLPAITPP
jgi:hypothetical protein